MLASGDYFGDAAGAIDLADRLGAGPDAGHGREYVTATFDELIKPLISA